MMWRGADGTRILGSRRFAFPLSVLALLALATPCRAQFIKFDATTDTIMVPGDTDIAIGGSLTIEARVLFCSSLPSSSSTGNILNEQADTEEDKRLTAGTRGAGGWVFRGVLDFEAVTTRMPEHAWHHVAFVAEGNEERLYVDGLLVSSRTRTGNIGNSTTSNFQVGATVESIGSEFRPSFRGIVDTLRVSKAALYSGSSFTPPTGDLTSQGAATTLRLYNFNDVVGTCPTSTTATDSSGNNLHGTFGMGFSTPTPTCPEIVSSAGIAFCDSACP